jgi:hypothetical protein
MLEIEAFKEEESERSRSRSSGEIDALDAALRCHDSQTERLRSAP